MKQILNLSAFVDDKTAISVVLKNIAKQLDEQCPFATLEDYQTVSFIYKPFNDKVHKIIDGLHEKEVIKAVWDDSGFYRLSFAPAKLNKWIKDNLVPSIGLDGLLPLPDDVVWDSKKGVLKLGKNKIQLDISSQYMALFRIYIKNHGLFIPHKQIKEIDNRFTPAKISSTILTMGKGKFKGIKRINFKTEKKASYRLLIK